MTVRARLYDRMLRDQRLVSKSKLLSFQQCLERLRLEIHNPELIETTAKRRRLSPWSIRRVLLRRVFFYPEGLGQFIRFVIVTN
jgi:hypothetical protein